MALVLDVDHVSQLHELFELQVDQGLHHGAQLAVYKDGKEVVNVAGGETGPGGEPTTTQTPHLQFSCGKAFTAAAVHQLAEQGALEYDDPVRRYWPDFAADGTEKASITVRHVLSHQAGLPSLEFDTTPEQWDDWDAAVAAVEDAELTFTPGTDARYHAISYSWIAGELIERVAGSPVDELVRENVFDPLDMDQSHIGKPADVELAELVGYGDFDRCRSPDGGLKGLTPESGAELFNRPEIQQAVMPSSTAVGTARDMARFFACLANGGELDGSRILRERTVERATTLQAETDFDEMLGVPRRYAMGFERAGLPQDKYGVLPPKRVFGHGGFGSSVGWADPQDELAMAYVTNGIREEAEHRNRVNTMAEAVRTAFSTA
jgi:CubicO group peptidase (beta-lactamase class C family)